MIGNPFRKAVPVMLLVSSVLVACQPPPRGATAEQQTKGTSEQREATAEQQTKAASEQPQPAGSGAALSASSPPPVSPPSAPAPVQPSPPGNPSPPSVPAKPPEVILSGVEVMGSQGEWSTAQSGSLLPSKDLKLRLRYQENLAPAEFERWFSQGVKGSGIQFDHPAPGVALVTIDTPPPFLLFWVKQEWVGLYTGEPPQLVLFDPESRQERLIGEAPASVGRGSVSPDGRWAVFGTYQVYSDSQIIWLMDLSSGERQRLPVEASILAPFIWYEEQLVIPNGAHVQYWDLKAGKLWVKEGAATWWGPLSPDGRYLAGFDPGKVSESRVAPATVVIHDLKTRTERVFPDMAGSLVHSCSIQLFMDWDEGGRSLLVEDHLIRDSKRVLRVDLESGGLSVASEITALPKRNYNQPLLGPGPTGWQVLNRDWGPVQLTSPSGESFQQGEGFPVGWTPDGKLILLRWVNYQYRMRPGGDC